MSFWGSAASWAPALIGAGASIYAGSRAARDNREAQQAQNEYGLQAARETAGSRGWQEVDPLLSFAAGEARRVYEDRLGQGSYASRVPRPSGGGASGDQRALAGRARELAMGGPGQAGSAGLQYIQDTLGGGGAAGGSGDMYRRSADMFSGLGSGNAASMYSGAFGAAQQGNRFLPRIYNAASTAFANSLDGLTAGNEEGGAYHSWTGSIGEGSGLNPNAYNINLSDPRFSVDPGSFDVDPTGGFIGAPEALDSQGYVSDFLGGENAPVGVSQYIQSLLEDPFAESNPQLENMIRLQQEDLQRAHQTELGNLNEQASNLGVYGGGGYQLARAAAAGELGRNIERAGTNLRYDDYNRRLEDRMNAMSLGSQMDLAAMNQAAQLEIANRQDLTERQRADLSARVSRELANQAAQLSASQGNQGIMADLARANQGTQAGLAQTGASLATQRAIANQSNSLNRDRLALSRDELAQRSQADFLNAMLGVGGLENDSQLGRLALMGDFAGGMGQLETTGAAGVLDAAGGLGNLELGSLELTPALEGIEMDRLGAASQLANAVSSQDAAARRAQQQWYAQQAAWDDRRQAQALDDLIRQGLQIGSHVQGPAGMPGLTVPYGQSPDIPGGLSRWGEPGPGGTSSVLSGLTDAAGIYQQYGDQIRGLFGGGSDLSGYFGGGEWGQSASNPFGTQGGYDVFQNPSGNQAPGGAGGGGGGTSSGGYFGSGRYFDGFGPNAMQTTVAGMGNIQGNYFLPNAPDVGQSYFTPPSQERRWYDYSGVGSGF